MNDQSNAAKNSSSVTTETLRAAAEASDGQSCVARRELDAAVAERVMGWHKETDHDYHPPQVNWVNEAREYQAIVNCKGQLEGIPLWSPSTDIAAAMGVVEKMRSEGWNVEIWDYNAPLKHWDAAFRNEARGCSFGVPNESLPEAICRAALMAVNEPA